MAVHDETRWPPLLLALRRATRPDRVRVAAYASLVRKPAGWEAYGEFLSAHGAWLDAMERALAGAGAAHRPLRDGGRPETAAEALPAPRSRAHALGYAYVLEAFRLGCSVLSRALGARAEAKAERPWGELADQLGSVPLEEQPAVVQGALDAFAEWERRLGASLERLGLTPTVVGRAA